MEFDGSIYRTLRTKFANLRDNDPATAYQIAKESIGAKAYYEEKLAEATKISSELNYEAERLSSSIGIKESPENVSKGQRIAEASEEVLALRKDYANAKWIAGQLQAIVNFLESAHFTAKMVYENASRNYRQGGN